MVMNSTSTEEVSIQAVFAMLSAGGSAASASAGAASSKATISLVRLRTVIIFSPVVWLLFPGRVIRVRRRGCARPVPVGDCYALSAVIRQGLTRIVQPRG